MKYRSKANYTHLTAPGFKI